MYFKSANGCKITDSEGNELIDFCMSHGATILGHNEPVIKQAVEKALNMGIMCSFDTEKHVELAEKIVEIIPCAEMVRFTNSGTEATLHALRLCRAFTKKKKIIRFLGHFHGYHEYVYVGGHPPREALRDPSNYLESKGIPSEMTDFVISIPAGDENILAETIKIHKNETAAVILEPINYNNGCIKYTADFYQTLRQLTTENKILLFFDEIQSSFKKSIGGAQTDLKIIPDICTIGKALGGSVPLSAICGKQDIMKNYKPEGDVQHSGTFNAHLISVMAGLAFLKEISEAGFYEDFNKKEQYFYPQLENLFIDKKSGFHIQHHGMRFGMFSDIGNDEITTYEQTLNHNQKKMLDFYFKMYNKGVFFCDYGGKPAHHGFSRAHTLKELDEVLNIINDIL
jgi:glutamate-1-semialdehyde 2,1-aminomutase